MYNILPERTIDSLYIINNNLQNDLFIITAFADISFTCNFIQIDALMQMTDAGKEIRGGASSRYNFHIYL